MTSEQGHRYITSILDAIPVSEATDEDVSRMLKTMRGGKMTTPDGVDPFAAAIKAVAHQARDNAVARGFCDAETPMPVLVELLQSELSGVLSAFRKGSLPSEKIPGFSSTEEKMADLIIRALGMSAAHGLRIGEAVLAKMEYSRTRPHKHGGKAY